MICQFKFNICKWLFI